MLGFFFNKVADLRVQSKYFFKRDNFIWSNATISFIYKLKNVFLPFQLTLLLSFWLCALFKFYFTPGRLGRFIIIIIYLFTVDKKVLQSFR